MANTGYETYLSQGGGSGRWKGERAEEENEEREKGGGGRGEEEGAGGGGKKGGNLHPSVSVHETDTLSPQ